MTDQRTKYVAVIVGGTPEEPWDVEREYHATSIVTAAAMATADAYSWYEQNARVTSIEEVL